MLYYLHGLIFGVVKRDYGRGCVIETFIGQHAFECLMNTGIIPIADNDNVAVAA